MEATSNGAASAISHEDAKEATEALDQVIGGSAESLSGSYRLLALEVRRGTPKALGVTNEEWCQARGAKARRWAIPERREAVAELTADGLSTREIGDVLGVDHATAARDLEAMSGGGDEKPAVANATASEPDDELPALEDTDLGQQADASIEVRRHRAMRDFMHAVEKTAVLLPQLENIVAGVLEVDAAQARQAAQRTQGTWERVTALLNERSGMRRVK